MVLFFFSLVLTRDLSDHLPHFPYLHLPGCQEKEFNKYFPTPTVWYCCEINTGSLAAILHWLQCCICSSAESKFLSHLFSSYINFTGAKAGTPPLLATSPVLTSSSFSGTSRGENLRKVQVPK